MVQGEARVAAVTSRAGWADPLSIEAAPLSTTERALVTDHYLAVALAEHASVAAFARFALQLLAVGAPAEFVDECTRAMGDETRHARFAFGVVQSLSGSPVAPAELVTTDAALLGEAAAPAGTADLLQQVVRLAIREGAIGESLASVELSLSAELASPPALAAGLRRLAEDEARHALLAFRFVTWALLQDASLGEVIDEELARPSPSNEDVAAPALEAWGILDTKTRARARADVMALVVRPILTCAQRERAAPVRS